MNTTSTAVYLKILRLSLLYILCTRSCARNEGFSKYQRRTNDKLTISDLDVIFQKMKCRFIYQQFYRKTKSAF